MGVLRVIRTPSALGVNVQLRPSMNVVLGEPPLLLAYTVYVTFSNNPVGVPQMLPLLLPKLRLDGKEGDISQEVIVPPELVGVTVVITRSFEISMIEG